MPNNTPSGVLCRFHDSRALMVPSQALPLSASGSNLSILEESRAAISSLPLPVSHASYSALLSHHRDFLTSIASPGSLTASLLAASSGTPHMVPPTFLYPHLYAAAAAASATAGPSQLPSQMFLSSGEAKTFEMLRSRSGSESEGVVPAALPLPPPAALSSSLTLAHPHPPPPPPPLALTTAHSSHPRVERPVPISAASVPLLSVEGVGAHHLVLRDLDRRDRELERARDAAERPQDREAAERPRDRDVLERPPRRDRNLDRDAERPRERERLRERDSQERQERDLERIQDRARLHCTPSPPPSRYHHYQHHHHHHHHHDPCRPRSRGSSPPSSVLSSPALSAVSRKEESSSPPSSSKPKRSDQSETVTVWRPY